MKRLRVAAAVVAVAAATAAIPAAASAATSIRVPTYRPITPKAWTWSPNFNKAARLDPSVIRLASPTGAYKWILTPKRPAVLSATRIRQLLAAGHDLRTWAEPVGNQGGVNSCVAWAVGYGLMGWWQNKLGRIKASDWFNPMSLYSVIRIPTDNGAWPGPAFTRASAVGVTKASDYAVNEFDYTHVPSFMENFDAMPYRFSSWRSLFANPSPYDGTGLGGSGANQIRNELAAGRPVAIAARVYSDFMALSGVSKPSSYVYTKSSSASYRGLHEMLAVGYNSSGLLLQNSWGTGFASSGYVRVAWSYVHSDIFEAEVADGIMPAT